ncbi:VanZ family protein [Caulobacter mirabilis]|nr:VanZ family protein [Caulobacter mirabilis]
MLARPLRIAIFILGCAIILWLSLAPSDELPLANVWDKLKHSAAYAVLTLAGAAAFPRWIPLVALALFGFGVVVELIQAAMPYGRQGDVRDALANTIGIAVGAGLTLLIREWVMVKSRARGE